MKIGAILFPRMDQTDFTGPFEVLSRVPDSTFYVLGKDTAPIRDAKGLILTPEMTLAAAPQLDLLVVPGGFGVNTLMEDEEVLAFVRTQAAGARLLLSVCTGALVCGAAGLRTAEEIQLYLEYAPEPPFHSGTPATAPPEVLDAAREGLRETTEARLAIVRRVAERLDR